MQTKKLKSLQSQEIPWIFLYILVFPDKLWCSTFRDLFQCLVDQRILFFKTAITYWSKYHITLLFYTNVLHINLSLIIL